MRICLAVFVSLNEVTKEKDLNSVMNGMNNVHLYLTNLDKILRKAEKVKIDFGKVNSIRNSVRNRVSAGF